MTTKRVVLEHNDHTITEVYSVAPDGVETLISKTLKDADKCMTETYSEGVKLRVVTIYETPDGATVEQEAPQHIV